jgi:hypothetical protein
MSLPENRRVSLELDPNHPSFLAGLDLWVQLELLSDRQILKLSRQYLASPLPELPVTPTPKITDFTAPVEPIPVEPIVETSVPQRQSLLAQILRSFQQELSVVWLLVLGVFLVVISSAVLAASQWQNVSPTGQYLVLLAYTLTFWGVSFWAGRQANLRLTASTLQTLTLLLVPVNFWAIDRFLLQSIQPLSFLVAFLSASLLSGMAIVAFRQRFPNSAPISPALVGYLGLSYLQCGWSIPNSPLIAVYLSTIAAAVVRPTTTFARLVFPTVAIALLFLRALLIAEVDITQFGLAFGIVGWLVSRVAQHHALALLWVVGGGLLGFGWLVSVTDFPWQALIVSGFALWFWGKLLQRHWRPLDVIGLLLVGLQSLWLIWRIVPRSLQTQVVNLATHLTQTQTVSFALLGVVFLPYLIVILAIASGFDRHQKGELAKFTEAIALFFGIGLTAISSFAPSTLTLNLFVSTIILGRLTQQKHHSPLLVYSTHLVGLGALVSAIYWRFPSLDRPIWAGVFLGIAIAQWSFSLLRNSHSTWRQSAWLLGFGAATLSYTLFFDLSFTSVVPQELRSSLMAWLLIPTMLSAIALRDESRRDVAGWASTIALGMAQVPAIQQRETGLLSLGFATALMWVNTRCLGSVEPAYLTLGFGLSAMSWWIAYWMSGFSLESWLLVGAIVVTLLWQFYRWGQPRSSILVLYARAANGWAALLSVVVLMGLSVHTIQVYLTNKPPSVTAIAAILLTTGSWTYHTWKCSASTALRARDNAAMIGIGVGLELLVAEGLAWFEPSLAGLSIANVVLGLITQLLGEFWQRRTPVEQFSLAWHALPLAYGIFALVLRSHLFTAWTGWVSLGVALIAIAVGRRQSHFKPLTYAGMAGVSIAVYELVLYRAQALPMSDQLMAIATVGTSLMLLYRWQRPILLNYLKLRAEEIRPFAHLHWAVSSGFLSMAAMLTLIEPTSGILPLVGFTTGMVLSLYAIWQARHRPPEFATEAWLYAGLLEAAGLAWYLSTKPWFSGFFSNVVRPYAGAISAISAFLLFVLPWDRLGWARQPWQRVALAIPLLVLAGTTSIVHPFSLIVIAAFYSLVASIRQQIRWTYLSIALLNWLVFDRLYQLNIDTLFWQVLPIGLSILYFAQVEPSFVQLSERKPRHYVRVCGIGLICATALLTQENYGILPGVVSLIVVFAGLGLRIRAFLYTGTLVFLLNAINQLIIFVTLYSLLKWIIGLCLGILLIWVAANFETRREQVTALMQNWLAELQQWQ